MVELLYNGYYGFEALTKRDLNDVICGLCGIAGKIYYGDGNEKNSCSINNVSLKILWNLFWRELNLANLDKIHQN